MNSLEALKIIKSLDVQVVETRDAAVKLGLSNVHASQTLRRISLSGHIIPLARGVKCR